MAMPGMEPAVRAAPGGARIGRAAAREGRRRPASPHAGGKAARLRGDEPAGRRGRTRAGRPKEKGLPQKPEAPPARESRKRGVAAKAGSALAAALGAIRGQPSTDKAWSR